jgi:hypothetical protein
MASVQPRLTTCDAFRVLGPSGLLGWVEEVWLGAVEEPAAVVVRLLDGRRGLLLADDVLNVAPDEESLTTNPEARLLQLDTPHMQFDADGGLTAAWHTSGDALELPAAPGRVRDLLVSFRRPTAAEPSHTAVRPVWKTIGLMYLLLSVLAGAGIGFSYLIAYLVTGAPPY